MRVMILIILIEIIMSANEDLKAGCTECTECTECDDNKDFKYCVWLVPDNGHLWNRMTAEIGFPAHMTVKSEIEEFDDAVALYNKVCLDVGLCGGEVGIKMKGDYEEHNEGDFNALVYSVERIDGGKGGRGGEHIWDWWPNGAHVSLNYKYGFGARFSESEISKMRIPIEEGEGVSGRVSGRVGELCGVRLVHCSGHFSEWKVLKMSDFV